MLHLDFIKGKKVYLEDNTLELGGSWNPSGTYDGRFLERCIEYIIEKKHKNIFDIGANTGQFALFPMFDETINIFSFEPQKDVFETLTKNVELNSIKTTTCYNLAISNTNEQTYIYKPQRYDGMLDNNGDYGTGLATMGNTPLRFGNFEKELIECITLDSFISDNSIESVDLIKIDTEGFEYFVISGALNTLNVFKPDIITEINSTNMRQCGTSEEELYSILQSNGYKLISQLSNDDYLFTAK